jgi:hypothetical protein
VRTAAKPVPRAAQKPSAPVQVFEPAATRARVEVIRGVQRSESEL